MLLLKFLCYVHRTMLHNIRPTTIFKLMKYGLCVCLCCVIQFRCKRFISYRRWCAISIELWMSCVCVCVSVWERSYMVWHTVEVWLLIRYRCAYQLNGCHHTRRSNKTGKSYTKPHSRKIPKWLTPLWQSHLVLVVCISSSDTHWRPISIHARNRHTHMHTHSLIHATPCLMYKNKICVIHIISVRFSQPASQPYHKVTMRKLMEIINHIL